MPHFYPATKTMQLFEECVARDQGSAFRVWLGRVLPHIEDAYRPSDGGFRTHLGISGIGGECGRAIFYNWRWTTKKLFDGSTLRLFNRGHLEEGRFVALLLTAGLQVIQQDQNGQQYRISYLNGHFGSAIDGVVIGCPDMPDPSVAILTEMKTHNDASFKKLIKVGVEESKHEHYVQMQCYMKAKALPAALYLAVNKNNDEIWAELVPYNKETADRYTDRGHIICLSDGSNMPSKVSESSSFYICKWCEHSPVCHRGYTPERNCRTCEHSYTKDDGTWRCVLKQISHCITDGEEDVLTKEMQLAGCDSYTVANFYKG